MALNNKRARRLWREEGLVCKPKARKKRRAGPGAGEQKRLTAEYPMHVVNFLLCPLSDTKLTQTMDFYTRPQPS